MTFGGCQSLPPKGLLNPAPALCLTDHRVPSMGTFFQLQLVHDCEWDAQGAVLASKRILDAIEAVFSLYQPESTLSRLNRDGYICSAPDDLLHLVAISKEYFERSEGAFDITILPALRAIEESFRKNQRPPQKLHRLRPLVNSRLISVEHHCVRLDRKGMALTFDGVAKGYAVDRVAEALPPSVKGYLLNFSGNMRWSGRKPQGPWTVGVWNPVLQTVIKIEVGESGAIASSGPERAHFDSHQKWHHIINPKTLRPPQYYSSVTVVASSAMECDILSTTFANLELNSARKFKQNVFKDISLWLIDFEGQMLRP